MGQAVADQQTFKVLQLFRLTIIIIIGRVGNRRPKMQAGRREMQSLVMVDYRYLNNLLMTESCLLDFPHI